MLSSPNKTRSIAARLVLLFTLAATLLLTCALGMCYWLVIRHAFEEDNAALADKLGVLKQDVRQSGPDKALATQLAGVAAGEHSTYWMRVLDTNGHVITETPGMDNLLPQQIFPHPQSNVESLSKPETRRINSRIFSLVSTAERANGTSYVIQIAQDRSVDDAFRREFGILFFTVLALSVIAGIAIARTTTKRGLRPLAEMTRSLQRMGPTRLNERVTPEGWPRELQPLAEAFDQLLSRLEDSFTRLSQFSADLAHELRTPIGNILGEAQVSLTRERAPAEYREVLESIVAECEGLSLIVDDLLFLARAESARELIARTKFDGRDTIEKIAAYYGTVAEERNVRICCEGKGTITADRVLFERAISNLVENALRFTPDGGTVDISLAERNNHVQVMVTDTGSGIAPEHVPRVFDRFYRVDPSRSSEGAGAGLGLALVKSIAELHGGSVSLTSKVNQGTTVVLVFPGQVPGRESEASSG